MKKAKASLFNIYKHNLKSADYNTSVFDNQSYNIDDLNVYYILDNRNKTIKAIMKKYRCSYNIACILYDMPLLNTYYSNKDNKAINFLDKKIIDISLTTISDYLTEKDLKELQYIQIFIAFYTLINSKSKDLIDDLIAIQNKFKGELNSVLQL